MLVLAVCVYSTFLWLYIVVRIVVSRVYMYKPVISSVPFVSFFDLGITAFVVSFVTFIVYFTVWGFGEK